MCSEWAKYNYQFIKESSFIIQENVSNNVQKAYDGSKKPRLKVKYRAVESAIKLKFNISNKSFISVTKHNFSLSASLTAAATLSKFVELRFFLPGELLNHTRQNCSRNSLPK